MVRPTSSPTAQAAGLAPPPPRTPSARARTLVFGYQGRQRIWLTTGLLFLVAGGITAAGLGGSAILDVALDVAGRPCRAEVTAVEVLDRVKVMRESPTEIRFACTLDGVAYEGSSATRDEELAARMQAGAVVDAEVLPLLSVGRVVGTTYATVGYAGLAFFAVSFVGLVLTLGVYRSNRSEIRAFVHGTATRGRVVRREQVGSLAIEGRRPWLVGWEFEVGGERYRGAISSLDEAELQAAIPTDDVVVLYDPKRPERNTVYVE